MLRVTEIIGDEEFFFYYFRVVFPRKTMSSVFPRIFMYLAISTARLCPVGVLTIASSITSNCIPDALSSQYFPGTNEQSGSGRRHLHKHMFDNVSDLTLYANYITPPSWKA